VKTITITAKTIAISLLFFSTVYLAQAQSLNNQTAALMPEEEAEDTEDLTSCASDFYVSGLYKNALHLYLDLEKTTPENSLVIFRIGVCYLKTANRQKAIAYLKRATELGVENEDFIDANYCFARAYHLSNEFDEAIKYYRLYIQKLHKEKDIREIATIEHFVTMCENGKKLVKQPVDVKIQHLDGNINSSFSDVYPVVSNDGSELFLASRRHTSTSGKFDKLTDEYNEDIFFAESRDSNWTIAISISNGANTIYDEVPLSVSPNGKQLYIYKSEKGASFDIWSCLRKDTLWTAPDKLKHAVNSADFETGCSISPDGKRIYFCSDRMDSYGGMDIYCSQLLPDSSWGEPINMGPNINTRYNDECPHIAADGKTLYFSSLGHNSMGGLDLFVSKLENGKWSPAQNMGYPINSASDEASISFTADMKYAFFSAAREDSYGDEDIYKITFGDYHQLDMTSLVAENTASDTSDAAPSPSLLHKGDVLYYKADFDFHSTTMHEHARQKTMKVVELMKKYPDMKLLVCGHAGAFGSEAAQLKISEARAKAVVDYMTANGITTDRLVSKGYGKAHIVEHTTGRHGTLKNRNVEFVIINDFNKIGAVVESK